MLNKKPLTIFFLLLFTLSSVQAASLGIIKKNDYVEINAGETKILTVLFWNLETPTEISLRVKQKPDSFNIFIRPDNFILNQSESESLPFDKDVEYMNLPEGIVRTYPVKVYVNVPRSVKPGIYEVLIITNTGNPSGGISVSFERTLRFTVNVTGKGEISQISSEFSEDTMDKLTGMASAVLEQGNVLLVFVSVVILIGMSWFIKRIL